MDEIKKSYWGQKSGNPAYNQAVDVGYQCGKKYVENSMNASPAPKMGAEGALDLSNLVASAVIWFQNAKQDRRFRDPVGISKEDRDFGAAEGFGDGFIQGVAHAVGIKNPNYSWNPKLLGWSLSESVSIDKPPRDSETLS